eukprot:6939183-Ditylum_brightwellii.AAC.1
MQHETLLNSHHLRANQVVVDDVAKKHGGKQCLVLLSSIIVPLDFNSHILKFNVYTPTAEELVTLKVHLLMPAMSEHILQSIQHAKNEVKEFPLQVPYMEDTPKEEIELHPAKEATK